MPRSLYARRRARYGAPVDSVTRRSRSEPRSCSAGRALSRARRQVRDRRRRGIRRACRAYELKSAGYDGCQALSGPRAALRQGPVHGLARRALDARRLFFPRPRPGDHRRPAAQEGIAGRLHFAGEHACYKFAGFMEGALASGVSVARASRSATALPPRRPNHAFRSSARASLGL